MTERTRRSGRQGWEDIALQITEAINREGFEAGVCRGVGLLGDALEKHFPRGAGDVDELPGSAESRAGLSLFPEPVAILGGQIEVIDFFRSAMRFRFSAPKADFPSNAWRTTPSRRSPRLMS